MYGYLQQPDFTWGLFRKEPPRGAEDLHVRLELWTYSGVDKEEAHWVVYSGPAPGQPSALWVVRRAVIERAPREPGDGGAGALRLRLREAVLDKQDLEAQWDQLAKVSLQPLVPVYVGVWRVGSGGVFRGARFGTTDRFVEVQGFNDGEATFLDLTRWFDGCCRFLDEALERNGQDLPIDEALLKRLA